MARHFVYILRERCRHIPRQSLQLLVTSVILDNAFWSCLQQKYSHINNRKKLIPGDFDFYIPIDILTEESREVVGDGLVLDESVPPRLPSLIPESLRLDPDHGSCPTSELSSPT
ncbi:hypothetical protein P5673_004123 [Acropora cervicornis]|uniref:Uncharacterized protein n=1 Tax=Acropora cervicornis TaxID=6130 RepID=A0AAD9VEY8_ACRCE|nr:hypothetical protein P5673_004123 [Acropora cervicornis]